MKELWKGYCPFEHASISRSSFLAVKKLFVRDVAEVCQAPDDVAGFSVSSGTEYSAHPLANAGAVANAIISAARTKRRFIVCSSMFTTCLRRQRLVGSPHLHFLSTERGLEPDKVQRFLIGGRRFGPKVWILKFPKLPMLAAP